MSLELKNLRILVTGPASQIGFPLASHLARSNEVWGIARFGDRALRDRCEAGGIQTRSVDLADPDFSGLPEEFDYVLHLAIFQQPGADYDYALRVNAEGTGLLMQEFADAKAFLVMSTCAVYTQPPDGRSAIHEGDPIGGNPQSYAETYSVSKTSQEAVARFAARAMSIPTIIARMNVAYGANGGLPGMQLESILSGEPVELLAGRESVCNPIHEDDIITQAPRLLAGASVPATIVNWAGDQAVGVREYCEYLGQLVGREAKFVDSSHGISHFRTDNELRREIAGPSQVEWREGMRRMVAARHPEIALRDA